MTYHADPVARMVFSKFTLNAVFLVAGFVAGIAFNCRDDYEKEKLYQREPELTTAEAIETWQREKWAENYLAIADSAEAYCKRDSTSFIRYATAPDQVHWYLKSKLKGR